MEEEEKQEDEEDAEEKQKEEENEREREREGERRGNNCAPNKKLLYVRNWNAIKLNLQSLVLLQRKQPYFPKSNQLSFGRASCHSSVLKVALNVRQKP